MAVDLKTTDKGSLARRMQHMELRLTRLLKASTIWTRRINKRMVVFEAFGGVSYACSPRAIYEAMLEDPRFNSWTFVWAFKDASQHAQLRNNPRTHLVETKTRDYYRSFARAKYWVVNANLSLDIAKHPHRQIMLQCFHGTPLKRLRSDISEDSEATLDSASDHALRNSLDTSRYNYFLSPSRYASKHFTSAFDLKALDKENIIIETGYPRNDYLTNYDPEDVQRIKLRLGIPDDKKVLLYAPTWRDDCYDPETGFIFDPKLDFERLQDQLGNDYVLLFRLHYLVANTFDFSGYEGFIYDVSSVDNINELYVISDVLMTDYSSVFFDYGNLQRPILFYMYDQEHYQKQLRGFYLPLSELPGDIISSQGEIAERLLRLDSYRINMQAKLAQFHKTYNYLDDGGAAQRVIDIVFATPHK